MSLDLLSILNSLPDHRRAEGKRFGLSGVVLFSILAMVCGARSYRQIHAMIAARLDVLNAAFPSVALRSAPAYSAIRKILQGLDGAALEQAFRSHAAVLAALSACETSGDDFASRTLAIDGKTLKGSFDSFADAKAIQVLSVFATDSQLILAHLDVSEKTNEIPKAQALIAMLGLTGRVFTLEAMHCQKNI